MSKRTDFINFIEQNVNWDNATDDIKKYWSVYVGQEEVEKPLFTDNGKMILGYMQEHTDMLKARDIAEGLFISSRTVSGAIRKLVTDEFVEKIGQNPTIYQITEKGKNINLNEN